MGWLCALGSWFACAWGCDAFQDKNDGLPVGVGVPMDAGVAPPVRRDAGFGGAAGGIAPGMVGFGGMGVGGFSGFAGFGGGFMMPGIGGTGACFECGAGCLDCNNGLGCQCTFDPSNVPFWQPPFESVGAPGWQDSTGAFCAGLQDVYSMDVWSDGTGVYALVSGSGFATGSNVDDDDAGVATPTAPGIVPVNSGFGGTGMGPTDVTLRTRVWHNEGSGWAVRVDGLGGSFLEGLTGFARDRLVIYANPLPQELVCRLGMTTRGGFKCLDVDPIQDVVAVNDALGYALMGGTRLLEFDGQEWRGNPVILPYPASRLWADGNEVIAIGNAGTMLRLQDDQWVLEDPGVLEGLTAIWGTSRNDLWLGTNSGKLLHFDGVSWSERAQLGGQTCETHQAVTGIWGSGGVLYAHTSTEVVRLRNGELESLGNWTCGLGTTQQVRALWGTSENDVFVAMVDQPSGSQCGSAYVAYFDGHEFHRM